MNNSVALGLAGLFGFLWLWQAWLLARSQQQVKVQRELLLKVCMMYEGAGLAMTLLEQNKLTQETTKELLDALKILHDRVGDYNHRLNELNTITRIKVQRTVDAAVKECEKPH